MTKTIVKETNIKFENPNKLDVKVLSLNIQYYSDGTSHYDLYNKYGWSKIEHSHSNVNDLIKQLEHEKKIYDEYLPKHKECLKDNKEALKKN